MKLQRTNSNDSGAKTRTQGMEERIGSLFQPDTLLTEDYAANFRRKIPLEPERILLLAILEDGIRCYQENLLVSGGKKRALFEEARDWLFSDDDTWFCSFVSVCTVLNLDPDYIRRGLRQWEARVRKPAQAKQQGRAGVDQRLVA